MDLSDAKDDISHCGQSTSLRTIGCRLRTAKTARAIDYSQESQMPQNRAYVAVFGRFSYCFDPPTSTFPLNATSSPRDHSNSLVRVHPTSLLTGFSALGRAEAAANQQASHSAQSFPKVSVSPQTLDPPIPLRRPALNFFQRFLAWAWSRSAYNDSEMQMTNFGWRKRT